MGTTYIDPDRPGHLGLAVFKHSNRFGRLFNWVGHAIDKRRTRLELGSLGEDGLKDLGLTRDHVEADLGNYFSN
ncbi:MAG: DUF1127 domain-containing protein [Phyllobacterium sp.]|uniref:DUF1127 domain-containing protein n=1 Tax=Phyllobacterium sp. TaxID=1871046 RepID=UPI0030F042AC